MARKYSTYPPEFREEALRLYQEIGASATAERLDVPPRTVRHWATMAGISQAQSENLERATEMIAAQHQQRREELRLRLMDSALDALDRMDQTHIDYRGKDALRVEWDTAPADAFKAYATAAAILIDKYRLEMGESTGRTEYRTMTPADVELERMAEEFRRAALHRADAGD